MDIQQYISSGIIEAYVLGIASEEEVRELERLSLQYPEIEAAVDDYRQSLEDYASMHAIAPPDGLKEQIWSVLAKEENAVTDLPSSGPAANVVEFASGNNHNAKKTTFNRSLAAAIALLIGSVLLNFIFWNRSKTAETALASAKVNQEKMVADNESYRQQLAQSNNNLQLLMDPAVKPVALAGVGTHTANNAMVLWDSRSKEVYLSLKNMPPPPSGKQYQLWAIVDGKPVDAGMFALNAKDVLQKMKIIPAAQMFAITLEKEGGSASPTMEEMYVAGKV